MKPATRIILIGAPVAIAASAFLGIGGKEEIPLADRPREDRKTAAPVQNPLASGTASERQALEARIARMPAGLAHPAKKEIAAQLVSSAEHSTLDWRGRYGAIEDLGDGNGYTAGSIGFCSGTNDMLQLVEAYTADHPDNGLARYLPALRKVDGSDSHEGLDPGFTDAWSTEAAKPAFRAAQDAARDRIYFDPAVRLAKMDGLGTLGQFIYYDAMLLHGPGLARDGFYGIRRAAMDRARTAAEGGAEKRYLNVFLDESRSAMRTRTNPAWRDTSRIDTAQRVFLRNGNMRLTPPLQWRMYGETFRIPAS
ncbi:chitosanase [Streptomyces pacificus]|uniref:Chitosanase n=1 Tax=Streptomyces pacificus TaxID=2705029 RepID=A0A6A0B1E1_9ACTN|nr:chitosanase [Streptomyces pacificus]GFH38084.1 chitosanase [Streptomyces pacificus]